MINFSQFPVEIFVLFKKQKPRRTTYCCIANALICDL